MKITVCIGSSCHLKGSRQVVEGLQQLLAESPFKDEVELAGTFCLGNCQHGVSVKIDEELFSVQPETLDRFFNEQVLPRVK